MRGAPPGEAARADRADSGALQRKVTAGFVAALAAVIVLALVVFDTARRAQESGRLVAHAHEVLRALNGVEAALGTAQAAARGFAITGDDIYLRDLELSVSLLESRLQRLGDLTADNDEQTRRMRALTGVLDERQATFDRLVAARQTKGLEGARELLKSIYPPARTGRVSALLEEMAQEERRLLEERQKREERQGLLAVSGGLVLTGLFVALFSFGYAAIRRRIAETVRLNTRLVIRTGEMEAAIRELEGFSYSVSHDLRAPLRAVDGFSRMLAEDYGERMDDEGRRLLGVIRENSQRMGQLIDDLLDFSRIGKKQLARSTIDMTELARGAYEDLLPGHSESSPEFDLGRLPDGWGDAAMLRQVFANLISNALKYVYKNRPPKIEVRGWTDGDENVYCVRDHGVGFDMKYYDKLYGVFQRLHSQKEFPGTGVGLAIVQRVVLRHGGRVWAQSKLDEGSSFYFSLPRAAGA